MKPKKIIYLALLILSITSCRKDYTCHCVLGEDILLSTEIIKATESKAIAACDSKDNEVEAIDCLINPD